PCARRLVSLAVETKNTARVDAALDRLLKLGCEAPAECVTNLIFAAGIESGRGAQRRALALMKKAWERAPERDDLLVEVASRAEAQGMLRELGVSSPELDRIVDAAVGAGAYGAKLTGGGQGGCVIALAADDEAARRVATAMRLAGAVATWQHRLEGSS
ncbi:MAG: hypothetical protein J0H73_15080, partial [Salana multivorans]|nr:hypothetical protein [Salana multivorans]